MTIKRKRSSGVDARQVARDWISRGVSPVPLIRESKKPRTKHLPEGTGWNKVKVTLENIDENFKLNDNVGGLWGKPSGWIVDVDLDWDEAAKLAPAILPETFVYGRLSRPCTHYLYRCKEIKTFKRMTFGKDGTVIIEVRSTGTQSVLPPSIHPDGERFEIDHEVDFKTIKKEKLEMLVGRLSAAAIFLRAYPEGGGRHDFVHALTGALLWSQWESEEVATLMDAIIVAASDRESDPEQRSRTVVNTIQKFEGGERVNGWPTLSSWVAEEDLKNCRKWCATRGGAPGIKIVNGKDPEPNTDPIMPQISSEAVNPLPDLSVPGLVGKIAAWAHRNSYADQPLFDLGAAFTILALATQNKYIVQTTITPLSPFFMALGRTGGGKDSARSRVIEAADHIGLADKTFGGYQSFHALLDELGKPPHCMCWLWDESARKLRAANKSAGGQDSAVLTWLLDLYGKGASIVPGLPGRKQSIPRIKHPFMTVMAFAQPEDMINAITTADISTGLLNRFILLDSGDSVPPSHYPDPIGFPAGISKGLIEISKARVPHDADFIEITWDSAKTFGYMRDFREECRRLSALERSSGEVWGRAWQNALILSGLIAVGIDPVKPKITMDIVEWTSNFMKWSCNSWMIRIDASAARSMTERFSKHLERIIREPLAFRKEARGPEMQLLRKGLMPRSLLIRLTRHMKSREIGEALAAMAEADVIGEGEDDDEKTFYWWKATE